MYMIYDFDIYIIYIYINIIYEQEHIIITYYIYVCKRFIYTKTNNKNNTYTY